MLGWVPYGSDASLRPVSKGGGHLRRALSNEKLDHGEGPPRGPDAWPGPSVRCGPRFPTLGAPATAHRPRAEIGLPPGRWGPGTRGWGPSRIVPAPALPEGARAGSLRAAPGSPATARLGDGGASSRRGRARRRFHDLKLHRELQGQPRWRRRRPRRGLLLLPPPPSPPPPPSHHGGGPGGISTSSREKILSTSREVTQDRELWGWKGSVVIPATWTAHRFACGRAEPPLSRDWERRSTVGGSTRWPRQNEGVDGKLLGHSSAPGACLTSLLKSVLSINII